VIFEATIACFVVVFKFAELLCEMKKIDNFLILY
jgi:hypothetical protein